MESSESGKVGVFILDDHQMLIDGIKALLSHSKRYEVVGEDTDGNSALLKIIKLKPHLVITDINMPGMTGIEFTKELRNFNKEAKICVLSMHAENSLIREILSSGANGYVLKNTGKHELLEALDKIMDGQNFISNSITFNMLVDNQNRKEHHNEINQVKLSDREGEILKLIAQEYSNLQIANALFISERTVETHIKNIFRKTNSKSVVGLIKFALEHHLI
jgi:DNA-binding NarL/FixJ family response regulator